MSGDVTNEKIEGKQPRDFIALARRILHVANQGPPRITFLRRISEMFMAFATCDVIALRLYGRVRYHWRATATPGPTYTFEVIEEDIGPAGGDAPESERLWEDVLRRRVSWCEGAVTEHGSIRANGPEEVGRLLGTVEPSGVMSRARSAIMMPFDIDESNEGVLLMAGRQPGLFADETVSFYESVAQTLGLAIADRRAQADLRERVKELSCLYGIDRVIHETSGDMNEKLRRIVELLPPAWQYDDIAVARIVVDEDGFATAGFEDACVRQSAPIIVRKRRRGTVEVGYTRERPDFVEGAFLSEEDALIAAVARELSLLIEREEVEKEQSQLQEQLRHSERLATIGQLAAGVAHEVNEPLGAILGFAQLACKNPGVPADAQRDLDKIISASLHAREIVRKLMLFARQAPPRKQWLDVDEIVHDAVFMLKSRLEKEGIELVCELDGELPEIHADAVQLHQVIVNLMVNGMQAMADGGTLTVATRVDNESIIVAIADTGIGMTEEVRERIFSPFFTTKDVGEGTGLGLSVAHGIVASHGGSIHVESEPGKGSRFEVHLPSSPPEKGNEEVR
jgi:signal transduction histidine kinase